MSTFLATPTIALVGIGTNEGVMGARFYDLSSLYLFSI